MPSQTNGRARTQPFKWIRPSEGRVVSEQRSAQEIEFAAVASLPAEHPRVIAWKREHFPSSLNEKPATIAELEVAGAIGAQSEREARGHGEDPTIWRDLRQESQRRRRVLYVERRRLGAQARHRRAPRRRPASRLRRVIRRVSRGSCRDPADPGGEPPGEHPDDVNAEPRVTA